MPGLGSIEFVDATLMTEPAPRASMARPSARHAFQQPVRFTASIRSQSACAISIAGRRCAEMPALFTSTWTGPRDSARAAARSTASASLTSTHSMSTRPGWPGVSAARAPVQVFAPDVPQLHGRPALEKRGRRGQADPPPAAGDDDAAALDGKQRVGHGA